MANTISGCILRIGQVQHIAGRDPQNPVAKREVVIDVKRYDPVSGQPYGDQRPNTPVFEFTGQRTADLDAFSTGQYVTISFAVEGTPYTDKSGEEKIFTRVRPYRIEPYRNPRAQTHEAVAPAPAQPAPQPAAQAQPVAHSPEPAQPATQPAAPAPDSGATDNDGLPF